MEIVIYAIAHIQQKSAVENVYFKVEPRTTHTILKKQLYFIPRFNGIALQTLRGREV